MCKFTRFVFLIFWYVFTNSKIFIGVMLIRVFNLSFLLPLFKRFIMNTYFSHFRNFYEILQVEVGHRFFSCLAYIDKVIVLFNVRGRLPFERKCPKKTQTFLFRQEKNIVRYRFYGFFYQTWIAVTFDYCKHKITSNSCLPEYRTSCYFNVEPFHHALRWCSEFYKCSRRWQMRNGLVCNQRIYQFLLKRWRSKVLTWSHCFYLDVHNL